MQGMHNWKVVPICADQRRDIHREDLIRGGHFRRCRTYKGGGGYDQFPYLAHRRGLVDDPDKASVQFIVQLYGCNLDCPYCYVTREGVWGTPVQYTSREIVDAWLDARWSHGCNVFHLMGGAPALQLRSWPGLLHHLHWGLQDWRGTPMVFHPAAIFHSDLMLSEGEYRPDVLAQLDWPGVLLAVNIKGVDRASWEANTRQPYPEALIQKNLATLRDALPAERWYVTFTNIPEGQQQQFLMEHDLAWQDHFSIGVIDYEASSYVDNRPWGGKRVPYTPDTMRDVHLPPWFGYV